MTRSLRLVSLFGLLVLGAAWLRAEAPAGERVGVAPVPAALSAEDVQPLLVRALRNRAWTIIGEGDDRAVGRLVHRGYDATVTLVLEGREVVFYSDSYLTKRDGTRGKREHPTGWIKNLQKDLPQLLGRKADESR